MTLHLMQVPAWLARQVELGTALVDGAVVKDAVSQQVLAHLQPTSPLSQWVISQGLGLPLGTLDLVSSVVGNIQLLQIKKMIETVQAVASIGAAASVLNLGVSVGGFLMVMNSLRRVESRVDEVARQLHDVATLQHADFMGRCNRALVQAEEAFALQSPAERLRYWREADSRLGELIETALSLLAGQGLALEGVGPGVASSEERLLALSTPAVVDTLRWLMAFSAARTELLLCLGNAGSAAQLADRSGRWLKTLPSSPKHLAQARIKGRAVPPTQLEAVTGLAKATSVLIQSGQKVAAERAQLCTWLDQEGVDTQEKMLYLHREPDARVLAWTQDRS
ncbi:MAG: hypothetical protein IPM30_14910 [Burkholderiales bacterium]|nr:hypothetical protein [Burkholderiales bacterium]